MAKMSVDDKLGLNRFTTDESESHITIDENYCNESHYRRLVMACPADLKKYDNGKVVFSHEGCLECGTCRVISGGKVVSSWNHPMGGFGIEYRQG